MLSIITKILSYIHRLIPLSPLRRPLIVDSGDFTVYNLHDYGDYINHRKSAPKYEGCSDLAEIEYQEIERHMLMRLPIIVSHGKCSVCNTERNFYSDYRFADIVDGVKRPNWRERMVCLHCLLGNRQRAAYHLFIRYCLPDIDAEIYITEQNTAFYRMLRSRFPSTTGSEYLGDALPRGESDKKGRRNEDLCALTFDDASFDVLLTYDVLEHVPYYNTAILEMYRILKPGGRLMISVPFAPASAANIVRARMHADGTVEHLLTPEYHGDPLKSDGCLCYYHFGWELIDDLRRAGFEDAGVIFYWSREYGYLGGEQIMISARKPN